MVQYSSIVVTVSRQSVPHTSRAPSLSLLLNSLADPPVKGGEAEVDRDNSLSSGVHDQLCNAFNQFGDKGRCLASVRS